ncbi:hypothetical protein EW026_g7129 [Hermanssonia centrifuga]|uniref:Uncharacterized protein n=1 Tax=Hermanssonia centrifuga TaxID=98765 RepID=A0A4S4K8S7_9APHY|nr:hypothetical protein EW026_g7129 [Hermanssonia centrifuga]
MTSSATGLKVPHELLYEIIGLVVAEYIDSVIAGPLSLPCLSVNKSKDNHVCADAASMDRARQLIRALAERPKTDPVLAGSNPVVSLLQISIDWRASTLKVLSDALNIPLESEGVGRLTIKPWTFYLPNSVAIYRVVEEGTHLQCGQTYFIDESLLNAPGVSQVVDVILHAAGVFGNGNLLDMLRYAIRTPVAIKQGVIRWAVLNRLGEVAMAVCNFMMFKRAPVAIMRIITFGSGRDRLSPRLAASPVTLFAELEALQTTENLKTEAAQYCGIPTKAKPSAKELNSTCTLMEGVIAFTQSCNTAVLVQKQPEAPIENG